MLFSVFFLLLRSPPSQAGSFSAKAQSAKASGRVLGGAPADGTSEPSIRPSRGWARPCGGFPLLGLGWAWAVLCCEIFLHLGGVECREGVGKVGLSGRIVSIRFWALVVKGESLGRCSVSSTQPLSEDGWSLPTKHRCSLGGLVTAQGAWGAKLSSPAISTTVGLCGGNGAASSLFHSPPERTFNAMQSR